MTTTPETVFPELAYCRIKGGISATDTDIPIYPGDASNLLPAWTSGQVFYLTITDAENHIEVVKVTDIKLKYLTVERGQDSTVARLWYDGAMMTPRINAALLDTILQQETERQVAFNPNGVLTPVYRGEKVFQTGQKIWWKNITGTVWQLIAGEIGEAPPIDIEMTNEYEGLSTGYSGYSDGTFFYHAMSGYIAVYLISGSTLELKDNIDYPAMPTPQITDVIHDGNVLITSSVTRGIDTYSVDGLGNLTPIANNSSIKGWSLYSDGTFIFMAALDGLACYTVSPLGAIALKDTETTGSEQSRRVHGDGTYIYVAKLGEGLHSYSVDALGNLTHIDSKDYGGNYWGVYCKNGFIFVCVGETTPGRVEVYTSVSGILTRIQSLNIAGTQAAIWANDSYVYVGETDPGHVHVLTYHPTTGALTLVDSTEDAHAPVSITGDENNIYLVGSDSYIEVYNEV
jgi:hypothetical protein